MPHVCLIFWALSHFFCFFVLWVSGKPSAEMSNSSWTLCDGSWCATRWSRCGMCVLYCWWCHERAVFYFYLRSHRICLKHSLFFFLIYSVSYFYGMLYRFYSLLQCTKSCYPKWIFIDNDMRRKIKLGLQMSHCPLFTTLVLIQPSRQQSVFGTETLPWVPCG